MPRVRFTKNLARMFPGLGAVSVDATSVAGAIRELDRLHPRLASYLLDEQGALRRHVLIFVNGELVTDRRHLSDSVDRDGELYIVQSLSGG